MVDLRCQRCDKPLTGRQTKWCSDECRKAPVLPELKSTPAERERVWDDTFLQVLAQTCNVTASAKAAGISRQHAYRTRDHDPGFAGRWDEAIAEGVDVLRATAWRLATGGITEPRTVAGERVDVKVYSERVLLRLLEAHDPMFRPGHKLEHTGTVSLRDDDYDSWLDRLEGMGVGEGSLEQRIANALNVDD